MGMFFLWGGPAVSVLQMLPKALHSTYYSTRVKTEVGYIRCLLRFYSVSNFWEERKKKSGTYLALSLLTFIPIPKAVHFLLGILLFGN